MFVEDSQFANLGLSTFDLNVGLRGIDGTR